MKRGHKIIFTSDGGPLVKHIQNNGILFEHIPYKGHRHPSFKISKKIADFVNHNSIDVVQAFDKTPLIEAYISQMWHNKPVYGMVTSQRMPNFRMPKTREMALVNPAIRQRYIRELGYKPENLHLIVARLDCEHYRSIHVVPSQVFADFSINKNIPIINLVSRIDKGKWPTIKLFVSAARSWMDTRYRDTPVYFAIIGSGPLSQELKRTIAEVDLQHTVFAVGERIDIPDVMNASAIVLGMASTCQQGLACGRPVIVLGDQGYSAIVDSSNFPDLAAQHFNVHHITETKQPEILCRQIETILLAPEHAKALRDFGREAACKHFDSNIGAKQLEDIYSGLLKEPSGSKALIWTDVYLSWISLQFALFRKRATRRILRLNLLNNSLAKSKKLQ